MCSQVSDHPPAIWLTAVHLCVCDVIFPFRLTGVYVQIYCLGLPVSALLNVLPNNYNHDPLVNLSVQPQPLFLYIMLQKYLQAQVYMVMATLQGLGRNGDHGIMVVFL